LGHTQTSKWLLSLVIGGILAACLVTLAKGTEPSSHHLALLAGVLLASIWNRLDSRRRGYEASLSLGQARASIKTGNGADGVGRHGDDGDEHHIEKGGGA
jgi:hypothetical protein